MDPPSRRQSAPCSPVCCAAEASRVGGCECLCTGCTDCWSLPIVCRFTLQEAINSLPQGERPNVLCSASAVGFYGSSLSQTFNEGSNSGSDYLAEVCREWEAAAQGAQIDRVVVVSLLLLGPSTSAVHRDYRSEPL